MLDDIDRHGWHIVSIVPTYFIGPLPYAPPPVEAAYDALFAYTVGLEISHGHPELVITGRWDGIGTTLNAAGDLVASGRSLAHVTEPIELPDNRWASVAPVEDWLLPECLGIAQWAANGLHVRALQLLIADAHGRSPADLDYDGPPQPLLSAPAG